MVHRIWHETARHAHATNERSIGWYYFRLCVRSLSATTDRASQRIEGTTYPLDLVRSRLSIATASIPVQAAPPRAPPSPQPVLASAYHTTSTASPVRPVATAFTTADLTVWGMSLKVMREEGGFRALYRGLIPTAMGVAPYVGACTGHGYHSHHDPLTT